MCVSGGLINGVALLVRVNWVIHLTHGYGYLTHSWGAIYFLDGSLTGAGEEGTYVAPPGTAEGVKSFLLQEGGE